MRTTGLAAVAKACRGFLLSGALAAAGAMGIAEAARADAPAQVTVLFDAFGSDPALKKDWGFSALIEVGGKRILFDTGNNGEVFAHNVKAKGVDLTKLDFVVMSHRHGDHTSGLNHLLKVNPGVKIYAPQENFGVFGAALPGSFYRRAESLPAEMRYYDGKAPETLKFGSAWPEGNFTWVTKHTEVAPGMHLILLPGKWGVDLEVKEVSLAIDTPDGLVVIVGCSHSEIEKIVAEAKSVTGKSVHLVVGGTHLLPAKDDQIAAIATNLRDNLKVAFIAPGHCTGEPAFAGLKAAFGDKYIYAGLGSTIVLGPKPQRKAEAGQPVKYALDREDFLSQRKVLAEGPMRALLGGASRIARLGQ